MSKISGEQIVLRMLASWLAKIKVIIHEANEVADGIIVVCMSNNKYGIIFRTRTYCPSQQAIKDSGGPEKVMPKAWAEAHLGFIWTECQHDKMGLEEFRAQYVSRHLTRADGTDIVWLEKPRRIPWHQEPLAQGPASQALAGRNPAITPTVVGPTTPPAPQSAVGVDPSPLAALESTPLPKADP